MPSGLEDSLRPIEIPFPFRGEVKISGSLGAVNPKYWKTFHKGTDFATPKGTPVYAVADGVVQIARFGEREGNSLSILTKHKNYGNVRFMYWHLDSIAAKLDSNVIRGEFVGLTGNSGTRIDGSPNPTHLHFQIEVWPSREVLRPIFKKWVGA